MNDTAVKEVLSTLSEYGLDATTAPLHVPDVLRKIGWAVIKFLGTIADALYVGIAKICNALSFAKSDGLQELVQNYSFILQALVIVTLVGSGLYFIAKKSDSQTSVALNLVIMLVVFTSMPLITSHFSALTTAGVQGFLEKGAQTYQGEVAGNYYATGGSAETGGKTSAASITSVVIANNMVDLYEVDKNVSSAGTVAGLKKDKGYINRSSILDGNWRKIKVTSIMDYNHGNLKNDDIWDQTLTQPELGRNSALDDMDGFFSSLNDYYYRWQVVSWFSIIVNLSIMVVVLFFVTLRCAILIFGIAAAQIYMPFVAATDLVIGQRIKAAIRNFISLFGALLLCVALMGLYFVGFSYIESNSFGLAGISKSYIRIVLQLALAWLIINGPDIIEQIIGVDVGLRSGWHTVMGMRAAGQVVTGASRVAMKSGRMAGKAAGTVANKIFGKKTTPEMPPGDGKRHGGLKGTLNGENEELKNYSQQRREDALKNVSTYSEKNGVSKKNPQAAAGKDIPDSPQSGNPTRPSPASVTAAKNKAGSSNLQPSSLNELKSKPTTNTGDTNPTVSTNLGRKPATPTEAQFGGQNNLRQKPTIDNIGSNKQSMEKISPSDKPTTGANTHSPVEFAKPQSKDAKPTITNDFAKKPIDFAKPRNQKK